MDTTGFDLTPWLRMAGMGVALAVGPLAWLALGQRRRKSRAVDGAGPLHDSVIALQGLRALTLLTLFLTFDLILFGAFTRLSDSGLGCPDWPGCYGHASPLGAQADIALAQTAMPTGPVTVTKAWIEMLHRYMATAVGVLILTLTLAHWRVRQTWASPSTRTHLPSWAWSGVTLLAVCVQGAFGALTVTMKLFPAIVTLHLLGGISLIALLTALAAQYDRSLASQLDVASPAPTAPPTGLVLTGPVLVVARVAVRPIAYAAFVMLGLAVGVQIALGGWVSTNYAVLACSQFPTCQGSWWPAMNFEQGFTLWRALGQTASGAPIDFAALTAIHYTHRLMAYAVLAALALCAWALWRTRGLRQPGRALAALSALQLLTGLSNVVLDWPLVAALAHTGGAAAIVGVMVWVLCLCAPIKPTAQQRQ